jgi:hypothetical protein
VDLGGLAPPASRVQGERSATELQARDRRLIFSGTIYKASQKEGMKRRPYALQPPQPQEKQVLQPSWNIREESHTGQIPLFIFSFSVILIPQGELD